MGLQQRESKLYESRKPMTLRRRMLGTHNCHIPGMLAIGSWVFRGGGGRGGRFDCCKAGFVPHAGGWLRILTALCVFSILYKYCVYIYIYTYLFIYLFIYLFTYLSIYLYIYIYIHIYIYICIYACMCV